MLPFDRFVDKLNVQWMGYTKLQGEAFFQSSIFILIRRELSETKIILRKIKHQEIAVKSKWSSLLDKVSVWDFQMDQRHLMCKVSLKSSTKDHI